MRHPFDGLNPPSGPQSNTGAAEAPRPTRRQALGAMAFAAAGLVGLPAVGRARDVKEIQVTTDGLNEEGGGPVATTLALGEEGGVTKALNEDGGAGPVTTEPFGEEAGGVLSKAVPGTEDGGATSKALGEEGGGPVVTGALNEGGVTTEAKGEEGGVVTKALGEGGVMTRARGEDGGPVVKVEPLASERTAKQLEAAWADLADKDAAKALQACAVIYGAKDSVKFLKGRIKVDIPPADEKQVARLIVELDSDSFDTREQAEKKLEALGMGALPLIQQALPKAPSTEVRMRLERVLERSKERKILVQIQRGLEVLVALRTKEAREVIEGLSKGPEKDWLTQTAKSALVRAGK